MKFKLDLVGTEEVGWDNSNTEPTQTSHFSIKVGMRIINPEHDILYIQAYISG